MPRLPLFAKNAYLSIIIKDNGIWGHLAYTDHDASRQYVLVDFTDLSPLRFRLDDDVFSIKFWEEYFNTLEKFFNWDIINRGEGSIFKFKQFVKEGVGLTGIRIQIDDNQKFFHKIFNSIRSFSKDISLRVIDDSCMQSLLGSLMDKLGYEDLMYIDMDIYDFTVYRAKRILTGDSQIQTQKEYTRSKLTWSNEFAVIDSLKDSRFKAFLATDLSNAQMTNYWSNFVLNKVFTEIDPNVVDILRSYSTIQMHSIYRDNKEKISDFGTYAPKSAMFVSGYIPRILGKSKTLLSIVDGLEISGDVDCYWDAEEKIISYGKSYLAGSNATDIILTRKDILPAITKILVPNVSEKSEGKVVMGGTIQSLEMGKMDFFTLSPQFEYTVLPKHESKAIVDLELKNGSYVGKERNTSVSFISTPDSFYYDSVLLDARPRPIVYGPDAYSNKLKLQKWINDYKA